MELLLALCLAWTLYSIFLILSLKLYKLLKSKDLNALERLMGILLLIMAIQMFFDEIRWIIPLLTS